MDAFLASIRYNDWILPVLLALPLVGAAGVLLHGWLAPRAAGNTPERLATQVRVMALGYFLVEFVISAGLWWSVDPNSATWQAYVNVRWIPFWGARFILGVDGIALMLILLTTFLMPLAVLGGWTSIREKHHSYYALLLVLTTGMLGVFMALDLLLFFVMWELMLVPMYLIIGVWGGQRRLYASLKFFLYTMLGSMVMLVAILYLGIENPDAMGRPMFSYDTLVASATVSRTASFWLFGAFFLAFAVKVPMWPFHTWLPDAHVEAPTAGSVILAAILLKMGTYGILRVCYPLLPDASLYFADMMAAIGMVSIVYGALCAMAQKDFKKLIAYSSVSHMGFCLLGMASMTPEGINGAVLQMFNK